MRKKKRKSRQTGLIGEAGSHFVVSEICRRGWVALSTARNTRGVDVVVMEPGSFHFRALQVKASQNVAKFWPVGSGWKPNPTFYFVFVRPKKKGKYVEFEAFVVSSKQVFKEKTRRQGKWPGSWYLSKSKTSEKELRNNWQGIWGA